MATMPREATLDLYLDGWTTIRARQTSPLTITRGRLDWAGDVSPGRFHVLLDNQAGDLDPDNPTGQYYGLLDRNTPMRFAYTLLRDTFGRTATDSWGSSTPDGVTTHTTLSLPWTLSGTAANFDVAAGVGTMVIASANDKRRAYLADAVHRRIDVTVDIPTMTLPASGDNTQGIMLRGTSTTDYVAVDVRVTSAGVVQIAIRDTDDNTFLVAATTVTGVVRTSPIRLRAQVDGQTIRGKIWNPDLADEPYAFHAETRSTAMAFTGWIGLRAQTGSGNTNVTFTWDNLVISSPRFFGVTGSLIPDSDPTGNNQWVVVEGAGILRRLERNKAPARSAPRVYIPTTAAVAYWPLEGGSLSTAGRPLVGSNELILGNNLIDLQAPSQYFGKGDLGPFLEPGMTLRGGTDFAGGVVSMPGFVDEWAIDHVRAGGKNITTTLFPFTTTGSWVLQFNGTAGEISVFTPDGLEQTPHSIPELYDGDPHHIRFFVSQNGGNVGFIVDVDGNNVYNNGIAWVGTLAAISHVFFQDPATANHSETLALGHLTVYAEGRPTVDFENPVLGWSGETAGRRLERLCEENSIPFGYVGDLDETAPMGPQRPIPLVAQLAECAEADFGTLLESRMSDGVVYLTGASLYNQTAGITLDYSAGQLSGRFNPRKDDQDTRNDVTARRTDGDDYRVTKTSGSRNTGDPADDPQAVGIYDASVSVTVATDSQLPDVANWVVHLGTTPDVRAPEITVTASSPNITAALDAELLSLDVDDRIVVENMQTRRRYDPVTQLGRGYTETLDTIFLHTISFVGAPELPYHILTVEAGNASRWAPTDSYITEALDTTETAVDVVTDGDELWTTAAGDLPFDVMIGGERMTVTAVATTAPGFRSVGTASHGDNATTTPGLPAGHTALDGLVLVTAIRNTSATADLPAGYQALLDFGHLKVCIKADNGAEGVPNCTYSGGSAGDTTSSFIVALTNVDWGYTNGAPPASSTNSSAQNVAFPKLVAPRANGIAVAIGWKQSSLASAATLTSGALTWVEIIEDNNTTGLDQCLVADYALMPARRVIPANSFVLTGGSSAVSKGMVLHLSNPQRFTVTRSVNDVVKEHDVLSPVTLADPYYLGIGNG